MDFIDLNVCVNDEPYLEESTGHQMNNSEAVDSSKSLSTSTNLDIFSFDDDTLRACLDESSSDQLIDHIINNDPLMVCISNDETNKDSCQQETFPFKSSDWLKDFSASLMVDSPYPAFEPSTIDTTDLLKSPSSLEVPSASICASCGRIETNDGCDYCNQLAISEINNSEFKRIPFVNFDNSKSQEPWNPNVGKKLLATYYSPINIKSEFLSNRIILDDFESFVLTESVNAFCTISSRNDAIRRHLIKRDSCPKAFVRTCDKVRAYRKLHMDDKITLLTNVFFDLHAMKSIITFDHRTDSFDCSGKRLGRVKVYRLNPTLHDGLHHVIETFPDRWRKDLKVIALIYLIVIFNPDLPKLKYVDVVKREQYGYIYLLGRYLESVCESPSDASDNLYRLMVKIEEIQKLRIHMVQLINTLRDGASSDFQNIIISLIQNSIS